MIRLVAAALAIYLGALVSASSYLSLENVTKTTVTPPLSQAASRHGRTGEGAAAPSAGTRRTIRPGVVSDSRTPGTLNATYR